jgi:hypothetical protein
MEVFMRKLNIPVLLLLLLVPLFVFGQDKPMAIFSYEDASCGAWVKSAGNEAVRAQYYSWFRGFVSGYNFGNSDNQVPLNAMPTNEQTIYLYIDKYCRENPLNPFVSAAFRLVEDLRKNKQPQKTKGANR